MAFKNKQIYTFFNLPFVVSDKYNTAQLRLTALAAAYIALGKDHKTVQFMLLDYEELCTLLQDPKLIQQFEDLYQEYCGMIQDSEAPELPVLNQHIKAHFDELHFRLLGYWYANYSLALKHIDPTSATPLPRLHNIDQVHQEMALTTIFITRHADPSMSRLKEGQDLMTQYKAEALELYLFADYYSPPLSAKDRRNLLVLLPMLLGGAFLLLTLAFIADDFLRRTLSN